MIAAPTWTDGQIATINDRFWLKQEIPCPLCGAEVRIILSETRGFPKHMRATCPGCGAKASFRSAPARSAALDEETTRKIVSLHLRRAASSCPQDGTPMQVTHHAALGGPGSYSVLCPRCGAYGQVPWSPEKRIRKTSED